MTNFICRMMVFPGSFWYTRRTIESNVGFWLARNALPKVEILHQLAGAFLPSETKLPHSNMNNSINSNNNSRILEIRDAKGTLDSLIKSYDLCIVENSKLSSQRQQDFYDELCSVRTLS